MAPNKISEGVVALGLGDENDKVCGPMYASSSCLLLSFTTITFFVLQHPPRLPQFCYQLHPHTIFPQITEIPRHVREGYRYTGGLWDLVMQGMVNVKIFKEYLITFEGIW